jgi:hypothetical protein
MLQKLVFLLIIVGLVCRSVSGLCAKERETLAILGIPQDPQFAPILGNAWALYLDGPIDSEAALRLDNYIKQNKVPRDSWVILNSPGGSLLQGMELGKVIRKYNLRTDVGVRPKGASRRLEYDPGGCYSACTLAYLGGSFRFLHSGSHFGVHRFASISPKNNEGDIAQVASAVIVGYLRAMDVNPDFFSLSTQVGSNEIFEPSIKQLEELNVVTYGFGRPTWTIESNNGILYLKGERDTEYGTNKLILMCQNRSTMVLHIIFDPQRRDEAALQFPAHSLVIDGNEQPISSAWKKVLNGWFNSEYVLTPSQLDALRRAHTVGVIVQPEYGAPIFLGFDKMPFDEGARKLDGLLANCGPPRPARSRPWLLRAGKSHRPGSRLQRQVRRAFAARGDRLTTTDLVVYCYPGVRRLKGGHYRSIWRAVRRMADCLGRLPHVRGRPNLWTLKPPTSVP